MIERSSDVLSSGEVARMYGVNSKTVTRWAKEGRIKHFVTPGGHFRFHREDVIEVFTNGESERHDS
jgi:excisionase family DNA binding protein